jgi:hypothetical protein
MLSLDPVTILAGHCFHELYGFDIIEDVEMVLRMCVGRRYPLARCGSPRDQSPGSYPI